MLSAGENFMVIFHRQMKVSPTFHSSFASFFFSSHPDRVWYSSKKVFINGKSKSYTSRRKTIKLS
jgi:hypothetical protein